MFKVGLLQVNLEDKVGIFEYDPSVTAPDLIAEFISDLGFTASLKHNEDFEDRSNQGDFQTGFMFAIINLKKILTATCF